MTRMKPHSRARSAGKMSTAPNIGRGEACLAPTPHVPGSFGQFAAPQPQHAGFVRPIGHAFLLPLPRL
jgi:hypothetical protein